MPPAPNTLTIFLLTSLAVGVNDSCAVATTARARAQPAVRAKRATGPQRRDAGDGRAGFAKGRMGRILTGARPDRGPGVAVRRWGSNAPLSPCGRGAFFLSPRERGEKALLRRRQLDCLRVQLDG